MKFEMWGLLHIIFIISPVIFVTVLYLLTKDKNKETLYKVGFYISLLAVVLLIARNIEIFIVDNYKFSGELLPLQICHFANFVLLYAFWKKDQAFFALAFCLNLPAALLSIIYANSLTNYTTMFSIRAQVYLWGHMLIVGITVWALLVDLIKIDKKTLIKTLKLMVILYIGAIFVNNLLSLININSNYFYTLRPENGTPLEIFFNLGKTYSFGFFEINFIYLILTSLLGVFVVIVFYLLYFSFYRLKNSKKVKLQLT